MRRFLSCWRNAPDRATGMNPRRAERSSRPLRWRDCSPSGAITPPAVPGRSDSWQRHRRLVPVVTIALRERDREPRVTRTTAFAISTARCARLQRRRRRRPRRSALTIATPRQGQWRVAAAYARSDRLTPGSPSIDRATTSSTLARAIPIDALPHSHGRAASSDCSVRGKGIAGSCPSPRSLSGNAIVAAPAWLRGTALLGLGDRDTPPSIARTLAPGQDHGPQLTWRNACWVPSDWQAGSAAWLLHIRWGTRLE